MDPYPPIPIPIIPHLETKENYYLIEEIIFK
jgi:hypothetical protein